MRHARWFALLFMALPGCQCLVPVNEDAGGVVDAGLDAGVDAGTDAGVFVSDGGAECLTASDCAMTPWASSWCNAGSPAGLSCVAQRCVSECAGHAGRACTYDVGQDCMACSNQSLVCNADTCPTDAFSGDVSSVDCRPGFTPSLTTNMTLSFVPIRGASCEMSVSSDVGGLGQVVRGGQFGRHFWFIREFGGWCVGQQLPTGAIRSMVACPQCTFVVEGF